MKRLQLKTRVIFRKFKDGGDIIALFPHEPGTNDPLDMTCYQHLGQHGQMSERAVGQVTKFASAKEYDALLKELVSLGYEHLDVRMNLTPKDYSIRRNKIEAQRARGVLKPYTVIGYYPGTDGGFTHHLNARSPGQAKRLCDQDYSGVCVVDILEGHHESVMAQALHEEKTSEG